MPLNLAFFSKTIVRCIGVIALAVGPAQAGPKAYIADTAGVTIIDTERLVVTGRIRGLHMNPSGVAFGTRERRAYVANSDSRSVSVIDLATNSVISHIAVGMAPRHLLMAPSGDRLYVLEAHNISVVDTGRNLVVANIPVGTVDGGIAISSDGARIYVTSGEVGDRVIKVVDTRTLSVSGAIGIGISDTRGIALNAASTHAYVVDRWNREVLLIELATNSIVSRIPVGAGATEIVLNRGGTRAYVANTFGHTVSVIDTSTNTVVATIPVGGSPQGLDVSPDGRRVFVANRADGDVSVVETATNTVVTRILVDGFPAVVGRFISTDVPSAPIITGFTPGSRQARIEFLPPASDGGLPITSYRVTCDPDGLSASGPASPLSVTGLETGFSYSCWVTATNAIGTGPRSSAIDVYASHTSITASSATGTGSISANIAAAAGCNFDITTSFRGSPPGIRPIPPTLPSPGVTFPHGLFDFYVYGCTPGARPNFNIIYPSPLPDGTRYWVYGPRPGVPVGWYTIPVTILGNIITFNLTDGGPGDDDMTADGHIVGIGGPGVGK